MNNVYLKSLKLDKQINLRHYQYSVIIIIIIICNIVNKILCLR